MVAQDYDDTDGDVIERARALVGPRRAPDPHRHLTSRRVRPADRVV
jgi:microcystin degradation protein MlrC